MKDFDIDKMTVSAEELTIFKLSDRIKALEKAVFDLGVTAMHEIRKLKLFQVKLKNSNNIVTFFLLICIGIELLKYMAS